MKLALLCLLALAASLIPRGQTGTPAKNLKPGRKYTTLERLKPERLLAVHADRLRFQRERRAVALKTGYQDYRAILHAHAEDSTHTGGTRPELLAAAKQTGVKIVMLTDHVRPPRDFINDSWRGMREGVLFIPGAESEGFLVYPQRPIIDAHINKIFKTRDDYIRLVKPDGGLIFLSHVEEKDDWETGELDGLEIYNHHTDFDDEREFVRWLRGSFTNPDRLKQIENLLAEYPMEVFGSSQDYLEQIIAKWDRDLLRRRLTGVSANDCHHNQVFTVKVADSNAIEIEVVGDSPRRVTAEQSPRVAEMTQGRKAGEVIAKLDFDPYERSLSYVTTHVLLRDLNEASVRQALRQSRAYVSHDWLCDPTGFAFIAERGGKQVGVMGDEVKIVKGLRLRLEAPVTASIKLFRDGKPILEVKSDRLQLDVNDPGVYRAEIWLELDGEMRPWIYSNAIRIVSM
ncbi:MAG: histidinol phosphatase [Acidobacteria bacterium]|nr:histidinol phosphatase [Acidobacteriota bacterium]